jgi:hypothetical protein
MGGINPSIPLATQAPQINALDIYGKVTDIGHTMLQNKLAQQQINTNNAVSDATKAATDPQTGQVDENRLMTILKSDPRAQANLPEITNSLQQYQKGQLQIADAHLTYMSNRIAGLLATPPGQLGPKQVLEEMVRLHSEGFLSDNEFAQEASNMPQDENGIRQFLTQHMNRNLETKQKLDAILGVPTSTDTGPSVVTANVSPEHPPMVSSVLTKGVSPEVATAPQQIGVTPSLAPVMGTRGQYSEAAGAPLPTPTLTTAANPVTGLGISAQTPSATGTPAAPGGPAIAGGGPAPAATNLAGPATGTAPTRAPGIVMGPGAARAAYLPAAGTEAADYKKDLDTRTQAGSELVMRMQESLQALSQYSPGAAAPIRQHVAQIAQMWGAPQKIVDEIAGGNLGAMQEFNKFAVQQATEALKQTLGANRIALMEFNTFQKANPNLESDPRAIQKMYAFTNKLYQRDKAEQDYFQQYATNPANDITQFPNAWQNEMIRRGIISPAEVGAATAPNQPPPGRGRRGAAPVAPAQGGKRSLADIFG